jgi:hypothetical protein
MNRGKPDRVLMHRLRYWKAQALPAAFAGIAVAPLPLLSAILPPAQVLPALCLAAVAAAAIAALFAWLRDAARYTAHITAWDVAGALAFVACAAAMLTDTDRFVLIVNQGAVTN